MQKKNKWILDKTFGSKRLVVTKDLYGWIVMYGPTGSKEFEKKAEFWRFVDIESMLTFVYKILLRLNVRSLELVDVLEAVEEAEDRVAQLGLDLDSKMGMGNG